MFKKLFYIVLTLILILSCTGCTKQTSDESSQTLTSEKDSVAESSVHTEEPQNGSSFFIMFIDVGQADSTLIMCDGHYMLIDGGNVTDRDRIYSVLKSKNVTHLDYVVGTHAHEDHVGGITAAFSACTVGAVFSPVKKSDNVPFNNFKKMASAQGLSLICPAMDSTYSLGSSRFTFLAPREEYDDANNTSLVIKVEYGDTTFLFMGDAERESERAMIDAGCSLSADLLKVGHHGSNTSSSYQFLREVMPTYAVISAGKDNDYGHPHDEVLSRLENADTQILRTDELGDIICYSDGQSLSFYSGTDDNEISYSYIGNINSKVLHTLNCDSLPKESNRIYFVSTDDAERAGYTKRCSNCTP